MDPIAGSVSDFSADVKRSVVGVFVSYYTFYFKIFYYLFLADISEHKVVFFSRHLGRFYYFRYDLFVATINGELFIEVVVTDFIMDFTIKRVNDANLNFFANCLDYVSFMTFIWAIAVEESQIFI